MTTTTAPVFDLAAAPAEVTTAYRAADTSAKAAARAAVKSAITDAVRAGDMAEAQRLLDVQSAMSAAPVKSTSTVDYAARIADTYATLKYALDLIERGDYTLPEGVTVENVDLSGGTHDEAAGRKLATVTGRRATKGSIGGWVESHLGSEPLTVSALRRLHTATDDYPTEPPSAGAISAWLARQGDDSPFVAGTNDKGTVTVSRRA